MGGHLAALSTIGSILGPLQVGVWVGHQGASHLNPKLWLTQGANPARSGKTRGEFCCEI